MARKKIVFVIVEGGSEAEAFDRILSRLYDRNEVYFHIVHGDITSDRDTFPKNIAGRLTDMVKHYANANHFRSLHFQEVIHLIDMDGAYIPDAAIVYDETAEKPYYTETEIRTARPDSIAERNQKKRENINRICSLSVVWKTIPYRAYYMSSSLDHVLYNRLNSTDQEKEQNAHAFGQRYGNRPGEFMEFIRNSEFSVCDDYKTSWEYIKTDGHSLQRHTNFGICFQDHDSGRCP